MRLVIGSSRNRITRNFINESDDDNESDHDEPDKSVFPTRPLPPSQLNNYNDTQNTEDESKIPTEEIKNRVLFSDAIEKSVKGPKTSNNPENEESESESDDDDYSDVEDDSEDEPVK